MNLSDEDKQLLKFLELLQMVPILLKRGSA